MNWEAVSAIAEWIGVILIIISLIYVALQVRQNTETIKSATELETGRMWSELHSRVAHSPDMVDIWDKGLTTPDALTPTEKRRFVWFVAEYFFVVENLYRQRTLGFLSLETWSQHEKAVAGLLLHPLLQRWWESGVSPYSLEFREVIDARRRELPSDAVWHYTPIADL
ncbi:MAG: hypothetical protein R3212_08745 [Xanthomonadales bacterium]|nr:hypothetical protein [Xanthomonadales bacterium]